MSIFMKHSRGNPMSRCCYKCSDSAEAHSGKIADKEYGSLSIAAPVFGPRKLHVNLGRAAGSDEENLDAVIRNTGDHI